MKQNTYDLLFDDGQKVRTTGRDALQAIYAGIKHHNLNRELAAAALESESPPPKMSARNIMHVTRVNA